MDRMIGGLALPVGEEECDEDGDDSGGEADTRHEARRHALSLLRRQRH
jgi:hypothetical protein